MASNGFRMYGELPKVKCSPPLGNPLHKINVHAKFMNLYEKISYFGFPTTKLIW